MKKNRQTIMTSVCITIAIAIVLLVWFFVLKNIISDNKPPAKESDSGINTLGYNCSHDETYQEPSLKIGNYYLDGDTSKEYFEVQNDSTILYNGDVEDFVISNFFNGGMSIDETVKNEYIETWSKPRPYKIQTMHDSGDAVCIKLEEYRNGDICLISGFTYKDENTFTLGKSKKYVFVDDTQSDSDDVSVKESDIS